MNKINVKQLLRVSKNIQRVPLAKAEGTIISTLPADNVKVEGRDITIFGSKKDVNLAFAKNDDGFVSSAKPVSTTVRPAKLSADLAFNGKTATIKLDGLTSNVVATLKDQSKDLDLGIINDQDDRLSIKSKDNGLEFDIAVTKQRDEYSYAFDFTMDGSVKPELNGNEFILRDTAGNEVFSINGIHMITENGRISTNIETVLTADGKCTIVANADYIKENILNGDIFIAFNVSGHIVPMITLESFRDGKAAQPSNDMYVFGYKGRQEYMLKATIRAKEIASELISRQSENFETLFTLNFDKSNAKTSAKALGFTMARITTSSKRKISTKLPNPSPSTLPKKSRPQLKRLTQERKLRTSFWNSSIPAPRWQPLTMNMPGRSSLTITSRFTVSTLPILQIGLISARNSSLLAKSKKALLSSKRNWAALERARSISSRDLCSMVSH